MVVNSKKSESSVGDNDSSAALSTNHSESLGIKNAVDRFQHHLFELMFATVHGNQINSGIAIIMAALKDLQLLVFCFTPKEWHDFV